jgi:putative intracellular protease/amidase
MTDHNRLQGLRVAILATDGFEEAELIEPRGALVEAGAKTTLIAPKTGKLQGMKHDKKGAKVKVDIRNAGGNWVDQEVVRDRNWVSSRQPEDIPAFNREMRQVFGSGEARAHTA